MPGGDMTEKAIVANTHRPKMDGSTDLICLNCLETIEAGRHQTDAVSSPIDHTCNSTSMAKPSSARSQYLA